MLDILINLNISTYCVINKKFLQNKPCHENYNFATVFYSHLTRDRNFTSNPGLNLLTNLHMFTSINVLLVFLKKFFYSRKIVIIVNKFI